MTKGFYLLMSIATFAAGTGVMALGSYFGRRPPNWLEPGASTRYPAEWLSMPLSFAGSLMLVMGMFFILGSVLAIVDG